MSNTEVWTVKRILEWTTAHLQKHGSESPRLEAEILLAHARGCERIQLYTRYEEPLTDPERATMRDLVSRRAKREPVAYLVGYREFYSLKFKVTADVLIPRPDSETLVMEALGLSRDWSQPKVLDLCTGSGCIAVTFAANHLQAQVTATDISTAALRIAAQNATKHGVADRVRLCEGNLFGALQSSGDSKFNLILSNPPYIRTSELKTLEPDVARYEPHLALDGGEDGLDLVRTLIRDASRFLSPDGHLLVEMDPEQVDATLKFVATETDFKTARFLNDSTGRPRVFHGSFLDPPAAEVNLQEEFDEIPPEPPEDSTEGSSENSEISDEETSDEETAIDAPSFDSSSHDTQSLDNNSLNSKSTRDY
ncbi:Release factor glutamine methyltransferase [Polystyrenella longa]|uniref:Release factor glutamine methyltransferase n=1 Tax=Polystyrenella longa TaxID=2528007 RepID=A0A518CJ30_9PLAN|nr:peptide chain release factor N(5)-glutamine methyltransferase [Polystyrenella longa]QDU79231.1 Release factor glutamine methyltransferase [Polystyrenella longa]